MLKMFRKIGLLLDARQKRKMVWLVFLMLIGALLEALGITLVIPIMMAIVDPARSGRTNTTSAIFTTFWECTVRFSLRSS